MINGKEYRRLPAAAVAALALALCFACTISTPPDVPAPADRDMVRSEPTPEAPPRKRPPNLVFLYTDEQRFDTLAAYGNTRIRMPHLDRLARQGVVFERAYVTQPVCTPSRSSILTGRYPHTNGCIQNNIPLRPETRCLPEMLEPGVYACAHMGKWHLGDEIYPQHGCTTWRGTEDTYHRYYSDRHDEYADRSSYHHWLVARGVTPREWPDSEQMPWRENRFFRQQIHALPEEHSRPRYLAEAATEFIRTHADRPFVLYVNFLEPHMPFTSCRDEQYDPAEVTLPGNFNVPLTGEHRLHARIQAARYRALGYGRQPLKTEEDWRQLIARYWGMCSLVDTYVGEILEALAANGLDEHTIVVFTSDHGDMMGSHGLLAKGFMYEESARVPLIVRLPGQKEGRRVSGPVSLIDIVPTLLDLMDHPIPGHLPGTSLRPLLEGTRTQVTRDVFIEWNVKPTEVGRRPLRLPDYAKGLCTPADARASAQDTIRTVVTADGWKLNYSSIGEHELFSLNDDPLELKNLAQDRSHAARVQNLTDRIRRWQEQTADHYPPLHPLPEAAETQPR
jgi:arylsulfatase A-like enzyme